MSRKDLGQAFEAQNALEDIERWRAATDAERAEAIVELMEYAEGLAASSGIRTDTPAKRLPNPAPVRRKDRPLG